MDELFNFYSKYKTDEGIMIKRFQFFPSFLQIGQFRRKPRYLNLFSPVSISYFYNNETPISITTPPLTFSCS